MKKQYNYKIVADNFDKSGVIYAESSYKATKECMQLVKLKAPKSFKINVSINETTN